MIHYDLIMKRYGALSGADLLGPLIDEVFRGRIALVSSFGVESAVLLHMVSEIDRTTPVVFLDTGKLFGETRRYRDDLTSHLGLSDVRSISPTIQDTDARDPDGHLWMSDPDMCCHLRKVEPLERALRGFQAWITGRKRFHGGLRAGLQSLEVADWRLKVNPLAGWSPDDIEAYVTARDLPPHPLKERGYTSVGCMPCTVLPKPGENARDGRWSGTGKTECGIHWSVNGQPIRAPKSA